MNVFKNTLSRLLDEKGMSQKDLAVKIGIRPTTVNTWFIRGSIPVADIAVDVAKALGVSVEYLVTGIDPAITNNPSREVLELAEDIFRLPIEYQEIIRQNVESYKALCFKLEKASLQGTG